MIAALKEIVAACKTNGIRAALHCGTPEYAARAIEWGFDMTTVSGDSRLLAGSGRRQRGEVPATDGPDQFEVREGSLLMPHLLIAGKLHPAGLALLERREGVDLRLRGGGLRAELRALDRQGRCVGHPHPAAVCGHDRRSVAAEDRFAPRRRLRLGGRRSAEQATDSALHRRRREFAFGRRTRDGADPRLRKAADPRRSRGARAAPGAGATRWRPAKFRASAC